MNFIKNNNFNNNAYRNNFGNNNYKPYPSNSGNGYVNSYGNSYSNNRSAPSDLEVMLKDFISKQTAFNKSIEEKFGKIDVLASKVDNLAIKFGNATPAQHSEFCAGIATCPNSSAQRL